MTWELLKDILPLLTLILGAFMAYMGSNAAITEKLARIEERLNALRDDVNSDHAKLDELESLLRKRE